MSDSHDPSHMEKGPSTQIEKTKDTSNGNGTSLNVLETEVAEGAMLVPSENQGLTDREKEEIKEKNPNVVDWDGPNDPE